MSQATLAAIVGVTRVTVTSWENGNTSPTVKQLLTLAPALDLPPAWFVEGLTGEFGWISGSAPPQLALFDYITACDIHDN